MDPIKILLVDDSKSARYALRLQLQRNGAQVDTADSAEAALERIAQSPPDAVLMDHTMPGMNGFEALEIIKSDPTTAHIPVVMCTSHDDPVYSAQAVKRGALCVITKAAAPERLHLVIDQIRSALTAGPESIADLAAELTEDRAPTAATSTTAPPTPPCPARDEVERWMEHFLGQHLGKVIEPHLEGLAAQLRQVIAEQVEMAVDAMPPPVAAVAPSVEPAAPPIDLDVLRNDIIPTAVQSHFDAERDAILQLIQQSLHESRAAQSSDQEVVGPSLQTVDADVAPQTTQGLDGEAAMERAIRDTQDALAALRRGLQLSYWIGAAAVVVGIGAAAALYLRLG